MDAGFCAGALEEALGKGKPEVFNTDQSLPLRRQGEASSPAWNSPRSSRSKGVRISMDGKGRYQDNIFVERLWRTVKYEEVYLKAYADAHEARKGLEDCRPSAIMGQQRG